MDASLKLLIVGYDELGKVVEGRRPMPVRVSEEDFALLGKEDGKGFYKVADRLYFGDYVIFCRTSLPPDGLRCSAETLRQHGAVWVTSRDGSAYYYKGFPIAVDETVPEGDVQFYAGVALVTVELGRG